MFGISADQCNLEVVSVCHTHRQPCCMVQDEAVGDLEHGAEHPTLPMAPADARPPSITRSPASSSSKPPPGTDGSLDSWLSSAADWQLHNSEVPAWGLVWVECDSGNVDMIDLRPMVMQCWQRQHACPQPGARGEMGPRLGEGVAFVQLMSV